MNRKELTLVAILVIIIGVVATFAQNPNLPNLSPTASCLDSLRASLQSCENLPSKNKCDCFDSKIDANVACMANENPSSFSQISNDDPLMILLQEAAACQ